MFPRLEISPPHRGGGTDSFHVYPLFKPYSFTAWDHPITQPTPQMIPETEWNC